MVSESLQTAMLSDIPRHAQTSHYLTTPGASAYTLQQSIAPQGSRPITSLPNSKVILATAASPPESSLPYELSYQALS